MTLVFSPISDVYIVMRACVLPIGVQNLANAALSQKAHRKYIVYYFILENMLYIKFSYL